MFSITFNFFVWNLLFNLVLTGWNKDVNIYFRTFQEEHIPYTNIKWIGKTCLWKTKLNISCLEKTSSTRANSGQARKMEKLLKNVLWPIVFYWPWIKSNLFAKLSTSFLCLIHLFLGWESPSTDIFITKPISKRYF